jgi:putative sterol carrier protein
VGQNYFQVQRTNQLDDTPNHTSASLLQLVHRQLDQKEKDIKEKRKTVRDGEDITEVSPWLERTQWIRHLEGQEKASMVQLVKPAQTEELLLQEVEKSLGRLVEKAQQTILQKKVSIFTLQRVESFQPGQDAPKPFHVNIIFDTKQQY